MLTGVPGLAAVAGHASLAQALAARQGLIGAHASLLDGVRQQAGDAQAPQLPCQLQLDHACTANGAHHHLPQHSHLCLIHVLPQRQQVAHNGGCILAPRCLCAPQHIQPTAGLVLPAHALPLPQHVLWLQLVPVLNVGAGAHGVLELAPPLPAAGIEHWAPHHPPPH